MIILAIALHLTIGKNKYNNNKKEVGQRYPLKEIFIDKKRNNFLLLTVIIFFTFMIVQTIISTWGPTFYRTERYFDIYSASLIISIYYITNFIGRIVIIYIIGKIKLNFLLAIISSLAFISFIFMVFFKNRGVVFTSLAIGGVACSGIVPILISTGTIIYDKGKGIVVTILFALSGIGESISPLLIKLSLRYDAVGPMLLVIIFMGITLFLIIIRISYNRKILREACSELD